MSSTQRGYERHKSDYYITPVDKIVQFINEFYKYEPKAFNGLILDPCAGGDSENLMSYPEALKHLGFEDVRTIDIREDSLAKTKGDFLKMNDLEFTPKMIITNPPFDISRQIISKSLDIVGKDGFVIMLLRLNYFGGKLRRDLWESHMPKYTFVHNRRMSFTPDGKTDSIEYAHFVWQKGHNPTFTRLAVID